MTIHEGYFFGEIDLLINNETRSYNLKAMTDCELLLLNKYEFKNIFFDKFR